MKNKNYEPRYIKNSINNIEFSIFDDETKKTLSDLLFENDKIVLLGNPGIGKTTELDLLYEKLNESKDKSLNFPFYINIKNFRKTSKFEDLIPNENWKEHPSITFILDGLDEIAEIQDFISEIEIFLNKNKDTNIKVVVSCRTNIFEKYWAKIAEFNYFYLDTLTDKQINNILKKRINIQLNYSDLQKYKSYIENPFNLDLFCRFYESEARFPETQQETWDLFIENELRKLNKEKFIKNSEIDIPHIKNCLEKIAFTNELMQQNFIHEDDLLGLIGKEDKPNIEKNSFIDRLPKSPNFVFRHKNYQEFFSAKYLSKLSVEEIISIIKISNNINKIKPSLFNTITFLLNIIDKDKLQKLQKWIYENEPEILFLAEKERINDTELQKNIFKKYFEEIAIEKTFWIGKNARFSLENISKFADVDFLIGIIKNKNYQFRAETSAYTILSYADLDDKKLEVKKLLEEKLFSGEEEKRFIDEILRVIKHQKFHIEPNKELLERILKHFKETDDRDVIHEIISMLNDIENIDDYFPFLYNILKKMYEITEKKERDNVIRGTKWILEKIFLKIKNPDNFTKILNIIFNRKYELKLSDFYDKNFSEKLIEKCNDFIKLDKKYIFKIIDAFLKSDDSYIYRRENFLYRLIEKFEDKKVIFNFLIENYGLVNNTFFFLSELSSQKNIDYFIDRFKNSKIIVEDYKDINYFKNWIFSKDRELGYYFEEEMQKIGFEFDEKNLLLSEQKLKEVEDKRKEDSQKNWDILFDRSELLNEIEKVFVDNKIIEMSWFQICDISHQLVIENDYNYPENSSVRTISRIIRDNDNQTFESVKKILVNDFVWLTVIKEHLKQNDKDFQISDEQENLIKEKCIKLSEEFEDEKVIKFYGNDNGRYSLSNNYKVLKTLFFFDEKLEIKYSKGFYLKTLRFCNIGDFENNEKGKFDFIKERINDIESFNNQVIININEKTLDYFSLKPHIDYAIENKLSNCYKKIGEYILDDKYLFSQSNLLERYVALIPDKIGFLKKCCEDINSYLCWSAIKIFKNNNQEHLFLKKISNEYLESGKTDYLSHALNISFYLNEDSALEKYLISLETVKIENDLAKPDGFTIENLSNYTRLNEINFIKKLFEIVYNPENKDSFDYHHSKSFIENLVYQLSKTETGFNDVKNTLYKIRENVKNNESHIFYINHLIERCENSYYESLAKPLTFSQAKKLILSIENPTTQSTIIMGDQFNFKENSTFSGNQFGGKGNVQTNYFNNYTSNQDVLKTEEILKEFNLLQIDNANWKVELLETLAEGLSELKESNSEEQENKSKTKLRKVYDFMVDIGKKTNDWKNLVVLPVEIHDKVPKLLEIWSNISKILGITK